MRSLAWARNSPQSPARVSHCPAPSPIVTPVVGESVPLHGRPTRAPRTSYWSWTRKVDAKIVTRYLSDAEVIEYHAFFDNAKRLRTLIAELKALSLAVVQKRDARRGSVPHERARPDTR